MRTTKADREFLSNYHSKNGYWLGVHAIADLADAVELLREVEPELLKLAGYKGIADPGSGLAITAEIWGALATKVAAFLREPEVKRD